MITLTESASIKITQLLESSGKKGAGVRLFVTTGGCSGLEYGMTIEEPKPDDVIVESHGAKLHVDHESMEKLKGCQIHFDDGLHGKGFEINNPNATSTCGCGRSFN